MWAGNSNLAAWFHYSPQLVHKVHKTKSVRVDMLDYMRADSYQDTLVRQGPWQTLQIVNDINPLERPDIDSDKIWLFTGPAADIQTNPAILLQKFVNIHIGTLSLITSETNCLRKRNLVRYIHALIGSTARAGKRVAGKQCPGSRTVKQADIRDILSVGHEAVG